MRLNSIQLHQISPIHNGDVELLTSSNMLFSAKSMNTDAALLSLGPFATTSIVPCGNLKSPSIGWTTFALPQGTMSTREARPRQSVDLGAPAPPPVDYEHTASNSNAEIAPCDISPERGHKVRMGLSSNHGSAISLTLTNPKTEVSYSLEIDESTPRQQLVIARQNPQSLADEPSSRKIAEVVLPDPVEAQGRQNGTVTIFPYSAAIDSLKVASTTPKAAEIADLDPVASSPEAELFAHQVLCDARSRFEWKLTRDAGKCRISDFASYRLQHPSCAAAAFHITVAEPSGLLHQDRDSDLKILVHHPSARDADISTRKRVLASLDVSNDTWFLNESGLVALKYDYVLDIVISSLLAVSAIQNDVLVSERGNPAVQYLSISNTKDDSKSRKIMKLLKGSEERQVGNGDVIRHEQVELRLIDNWTWILKDTIRSVHLKNSVRSVRQLVKSIR